MPYACSVGSSGFALGMAVGGFELRASCWWLGKKLPASTGAFISQNKTRLTVGKSGGFCALHRAGSGGLVAGGYGGEFVTVEARLLLFL